MARQRSKKTIYQGISFDSLAEKERYLQLVELERRGEISKLRVHCAAMKFVLIPKYEYTNFDGKIVKVREAIYTPDFDYYIGNRYIVEDVKGYPTDLFNYKAKLFRRLYPNIVFRIMRYRGGVKKGYVFYDA